MCYFFNREGLHNYQDNSLKLFEVFKACYQQLLTRIVNEEGKRL